MGIDPVIHVYVLAVVRRWSGAAPAGSAAALLCLGRLRGRIAGFALALKLGNEPALATHLPVHRHEQTHGQDQQRQHVSIPS